MRNIPLRLIPVYRDESKEFFVKEEELAPQSVNVGSARVSTNWLLAGRSFPLIGLSNIDQLRQSQEQLVEDAPVYSTIAVEKILLSYWKSDRSKDLKFVEIELDSQNARTYDLQERLTREHTSVVRSKIELDIPGLEQVQVKLGLSVLISKVMGTMRVDAVVNGVQCRLCDGALKFAFEGYKIKGERTSWCRGY